MQMMSLHQCLLVELNKHNKLLINAKKRRAKRNLSLTSMKLKMEPTSDPLASANSEIASNIIASYLKIATHQTFRIDRVSSSLKQRQTDRPGSVLVIHHKVINAEIRRSTAWKGSSWRGGWRVSKKRWSRGSSSRCNWRHSNAFVFDFCRCSRLILYALSTGSNTQVTPLILTKHWRNTHINSRFLFTNSSPSKKRETP